MTMRTTPLSILCATALLCVFIAAPAFAAEEYVKAAKLALPSTVSIVVSSATGSGFIIKAGADYYVVTANSVIGQNQAIKVETPDGKQYDADVQLQHRLLRRRP